MIVFVDGGGRGVLFVEVWVDVFMILRGELIGLEWLIVWVIMGEMVIMLVVVVYVVMEG